MALISTAGAVNANSYVDESTATAYMTGSRLHTSEWQAASTATREAALIWATSLLDTSIEWRGSKRTLAQALRWPRSGVTDRDSHWLDYDTIPRVLEEATAELANHLLIKDRVKVSTFADLGLTSVRAGSVALEIDPIRKAEIIPPHVFEMLAHLGRADGGSGGTAKLIRT